MKLALALQYSSSISPPQPFLSSMSMRKSFDIMSELLKTNCFYIGALGNHAVHRDRIAALTLQGIDESDLQRIRAPVGCIPAAKSMATLAVGVLAEMMTEAKTLNLVS